MIKPAEQQWKENPELLFQLRREAVTVYFEARGSCKGGCAVEFLVSNDGQVTATGIESLMKAFLSPVLINGLPGGSPNLINMLVANHKLARMPSDTGTDLGDLPNLAAAYDAYAPTYDVDGQALVEKFEFEGIVLDLACGTGYFGRILRKHQSRQMNPWQDDQVEDFDRASESGNLDDGTSRATHLTGCDISPGMARLCSETGAYDLVRLGHIQTSLSEYPFLLQHDAMDHIVCFGAAYLLSFEELTFMLVSCFASARRSLTIGVDEVPDAYSEYMDGLGMGYLRGNNHVAQMDQLFTEPPGWRLVSRDRRFSWTWPDGKDVYAVFYRFERVEEAGRNMILSIRDEKEPWLSFIDDASFSSLKAGAPMPSADVDQLCFL
ncbi:hypothetical protein BJY04DRAFT_216157 [Aspergillus karnatakaensis]|uniref:uncharacterized protein n=1 Tax=Aspergillus karnatakaensis TaxID=1810916 RepID=UPI003CCE38FB